MRIRSLVFVFFCVAPLASAGCCFWQHHRCCYPAAAPEARPWPPAGPAGAPAP